MSLSVNYSGKTGSPQAARKEKRRADFMIDTKIHSYITAEMSCQKPEKQESKYN
jgi:hypothetical protein